VVLIPADQIPKDEERKNAFKTSARSSGAFIFGFLRYKIYRTKKKGKFL
jgi:hypothetical protein